MRSESPSGISVRTLTALDGRNAGRHYVSAGRLMSGEALSDVDRTLLNGHYAAALQTQHMRGLVEALEGGTSTSVAVISLNQRDRGRHAWMAFVRTRRCPFGWWSWMPGAAIRSRWTRAST